MMVLNPEPNSDELFPGNRMDIEEQRPKHTRHRQSDKLHLVEVFGEFAPYAPCGTAPVRGGEIATIPRAIFGKVVS